MGRQYTRVYRIIRNITAHDVSESGHPRYRVHFTDGTSALTEVDSALGDLIHARSWTMPGPATWPYHVPVVVTLVGRNARVFAIDEPALHRGRTVKVPLFYAAPGDWALHYSGDLDPREVVKVDPIEDRVWLYILTGPAGPYPATNYEYSRKV